MVDSTGMIALGVVGAGGVVAYQTLGSGSEEDGGSQSKRGGFKGIPAQAGRPLGVPSTQNTSVKKVNYSPESSTKTVNVNTQPRAGSTSTETSKKEDKKESGSSGSSGSSGNSGGSGGGSRIDVSNIEPDNKVSKKTQESIDKTTPQPGDTPSQATKKLDKGQGYTRSRSTAEMSNEELGLNTSKKEDKSSDSGGLLDSWVSGDWF